MSLSSVTEGGAPRSGWKLTLHGPSTVDNCDSATLGSVRDVAVAGWRKTTKTVPHGSRFRGTVVRPSAIVNEAGSALPVSACHNSGALPVTLKVASTFAASSPRLATK